MQGVPVCDLSFFLMAGTAAPGLPLLLAPVTTWTPSWGHTMTSATLRLPATTIIITSVQMYRKDRTTKHKCKLPSPPAQLPTVL